MGDTKIGQPYNPLDHDIRFWGKCLREGMAAEFSPDQYRDLPTREQQDAFCQKKLDEAVVEYAAVQEIVDLCEECQVLLKRYPTIPVLLKAHEDH